MINRCAEGNLFSVHIDENLGKTCTKEEEPNDCSSCNEGEEISVIAASNAVVEPDTVMILSLNTIITYSAMVSSRRSPYIASFAIFGGDFHGSGS